MERHLTNLTDKRRQVTKKSLIHKKGKRKHSLRNIMNAILYLLSKELLGKKTIISEACNLRDNYQALQARGANTEISYHKKLVQALESSHTTPRLFSLAVFMLKAEKISSI